MSSMEEILKLVQDGRLGVEEAAGRLRSMQIGAAGVAGAGGGAAGEGHAAEEYGQVAGRGQGEAGAAGRTPGTDEPSRGGNGAGAQAEPAVADLGFATLDLQREKRTGFPEVIFGEGKTAEQLLAIFQKLREHTDRVLATRVDAAKAQVVLAAVEGAAYHPAARALTWFKHPILRVHEGYVAVVCAGTSDLPVAEEAALTAECMGSHVERIYDVGVAGIHRLFRRLPVIRGANAVVVAAGMEGALTSVVGGLVDKPVIAVPTSIGYGASFQGMAALLAMLNACSPGITVVNIDNGFGAGYAAGLINKNLSEKVD